MTRWVTALLGVLAILTLTPAPSRAQGGSATSLSGVVVDSDGGVIPGATVVVKHTGTAATFQAVTTSAGLFNVPALAIGTYTVTVSLSGFKTVVINDVRIVTGTPTAVKATLQVGALTETVEVRGGAPLVQTQSATVSSTLSVEQISNLPLVTRNALNFLTFLPGVDTVSEPRDATINGLPQNTLNVTVDGVNVNNNLQSGDGFYSMIRPNLDAVEEVTVTGAVPGADGGGNGAVQVKFVTRSGTSQLDASAYHYFRHPSLNSNYYFNTVNKLEKSRVILHQVGGRVGGPLAMPGLARGKAFYFFNYEEFRQPAEQTRNRVILSPAARQGLFSYNVSGGTAQVNLLGLAAANGHVSTIDPDLATLLDRIRTAASGVGTISDTQGNANTQQYFFQVSGSGVEHLPTTRLDFNLTDRHRLSGTYYWQQITRDPDILNNQDPTFPGFPTRGAFDSIRHTLSLRVRSTLSPTMVNELTYGLQTAPLEFATNAVPSDFADQYGYALTLGFGLTSPTANSANGPSNRNTTNWNIDNTLNWQRGSHSLNVGFSFTRVSHRETAYNNVPAITFGVDTTNDPANGFFTTANFPGASATNLNDARALYALLTGRVTAINGTARIAESGSEYVYLGPRTQRAQLSEFGLFAQDSWRITPTLTVNYGARWEVQLPFRPLNDAYSRTTLADACGVSGLGAGPDGRPCRMFDPTATGGVRPSFVQFFASDRVYRTDWNNIAPNVGVAWRPHVSGGWLRAILGDPEQATLRAGYAMSFTRNRMDEFTGVYAGNTGSTFNANRSAATGSLVPVGQSWPVLFREKDRLGPPPIPSGPSYPIQASVQNANAIGLIDPDITLGHVKSYTVGFQRSLSQDMALEVRYVGNQNVRDWVGENFNEVNLFENGFLQEFTLAQANLAANVAAGRAATFAYPGPRDRDVAAADLPGALQRPGRRGQRRRLYRHQLDEHDAAGGPVLHQPAAGDGRRRARWHQRRRADVAPECRARGIAGQLLRHEPGRDQRQRHACRRRQPVPRAAGRTPTPPVARIFRERQLCPLAARRAGPGHPAQASRVRALHRRQRRHPSRREADLQLRAADWTRPAVRQRDERVDEWRLRRLDGQPDGPCPVARAQSLWRPAGRHDRAGTGRGLSVPDRRESHRGHDGLLTTGRHHPEHHQGLQRGPDLGRRLQPRPRRAGRALHRAGQHRRLHQGLPGRLRRTTAHLRDDTGLLEVRHQLQEAARAGGQAQRRTRGGHHQPLRQHQLQPGAGRVQLGDPQSGHVGLPGHGQHVRPWRPAGTNRVENQLVEGMW